MDTRNFAFHVRAQGMHRFVVADSSLSLFADPVLLPFVDCVIGILIVVSQNTQYSSMKSIYSQFIETGGRHVWVGELVGEVRKCYSEIIILSWYC